MRSELEKAAERLTQILDTASKRRPLPLTLVEILAENNKKPDALKFAWNAYAGQGMFEFNPLRKDQSEAAEHLLKIGRAAPGKTFQYFGVIARPVQLIENLHWGLDENDGVVLYERAKDDPHKDIIIRDSKTYAPAISAIRFKLATGQASLAEPLDVSALQLRPVIFKPS